jgi:uncharacterized protein (DUF305 family)
VSVDDLAARVDPTAAVAEADVVADAVGAGAADPTTEGASGVDRLEPRRFSGVVLALVAAVALSLGALVGAALAGGARTPSTVGEGSVEAGFARDMQVHHAQAVELAVLVRDRSDDEELRTVALDILLTQQNQIGQMASWLRAWNLPAASSAAPMAWMAGEAGPGSAAHAGHHGAADARQDGYASMPGWASAEDLARLRAATGAEADRIFLELMIAHHRGGVAMASYAAEHASVAQVVELARGIVTTQERETAALEDLLARR